MKSRKLIVFHQPLNMLKNNYPELADTDFYQDFFSLPSQEPRPYEPKFEHGRKGISLNILPTVN